MEAYNNHPSLYFVDGNIILIAPQSFEKFVVFRVHRTILAKISPVFKTMFMLPDGDGAQKYDGLPLVYLPDSAEHVEILLKLVYHETDLPWKPSDPSTPDLVKHILSLATKYDIDHFRRRIIDHLEQDWPLTLLQWDQLELNIDGMKRIKKGYLYHDDDTQSIPLDDCLPEPASAIRLAREYAIPTILPAAFYHLSRLTVYDDWAEARKFEDELENGRRTAKWGLLSAEDLICLMKGKVKLGFAANEMLHTFEVQGCSDGCAPSRFQLRVEICKACRHSTDILSTTRSFIERKTYGDDICDICASHIRHDLATFRHQVWVELPKYFCLE